MFFKKKGAGRLYLARGNALIVLIEKVARIERGGDMAQEWYRLRSFFDTFVLQSDHDEVIRALRDLRGKASSWVMEEEIDEVVASLQKQKEEQKKDAQC